MIARLHDKVAEYINKSSNIEQWQDIRKKYFEYSFLAFMCVCAHELKSECKTNEVKKIICDNKIVEEHIVSYILGIPLANEFVTEIINLVKEYEKYDLNSLYQGYLSRDFVLVDGVVVFAGGKNNRDILGSYYTQEEFAYEITKKAVNDYILNLKVKKKVCLKVADYSCGGGAFLIAACKICQERNIPLEVYGYDVDPIAVMITRLRLIKKACSLVKKVSISLGNPLMYSEMGVETNKKFELAELGRFYCLEMGIIPESNMSIIVGNPPWEKIRFEEKKFLNHYVKNEDIDTKAGRKSYIEKISEDNRIFYNAFVADYQEAKKCIKRSPILSLSCYGELNTYALFTEMCRNLLCDDGIVGLIVKSSLVKMPVYSKFFRDMTKSKDLYEIYMFVNRKKIFNIDSREEFSVIYLKKDNRNSLKLALNLDDYENFCCNEKIELTYNLLNRLNPDTGMIPNISNNEELLFLTSVYENQQTFGDLYTNCRFGRLVHLTNHSAFIKKNSEDGYVPIYEGKFIELYTGKYATFSEMQGKDKYKNKATARNIVDIDGREYPEARFYIQEELWNSLSKNFIGNYIIAWRSLTSATNKRTMMATILPLIPTCQSIQILQLPQIEMLRVLATFNSVVFDYIVRLKMAGLDLTQTIVKQMPMPDVEGFNTEICFMGKIASIDKHINSRIKVLYLSDERLDNMFNGIETYNLEGTKTRKQIVAELDILVAIAYGINMEDFKRIVLSFDRYYTKEETKKWF